MSSVHIMRLFSLEVCAVLLCAASNSFSIPAHAQQRQVVQYSNGTGFFVSRFGHLVTNAHVVEKCRSAQVSGRRMIAHARIIALDSENDMALLQANTTPGDTASFRQASHQLTEGDELVIVGHPLGKSLTTATSKLISDQGPLGEPQWLQFSNSIFQGNSGGPLLDKSGQVVGMIMAKSTLYRYNSNLARNEVVGNSDIAIRTPILEDFLGKHRVRLRYSTSQIDLSPSRIEQRAKDYVVKIKCVVSS